MKSLRLFGNITGEDVLLAVFVPTSFMAGMTGVMYKQFALTIAAAGRTSTPCRCAGLIALTKASTPMTPAGTGTPRGAGLAVR